MRSQAPWHDSGCVLLIFGGRKVWWEMFGGIGELILMGWLGLIVYLVYKLIESIGNARHKG